jgi:Carboxypeptidase regulatory-like domain
MRFKQPFGLAALLATFMLLLPGMAAAQSIVTGAVGGTVTDSSGAVIAGAAVNLKSKDTGAVLSATTSTTGSYQFTLLKPGSYTLEVSQTGFKLLAQATEVLLGQITLANIKLEVGATSDTVTVSEQGALLQTEDANISSNFDTNQIQNIPNPGNDITYVAQTAPGVIMNNSTLGGYGNFEAFGLPATANLFTINGNDYNDPFLNLNNSGASNLLLGGNELQEVAVVSNAYTGQYGRQAGAQIDYSTKSGTNAYHGNSVYNWTGRDLNANDPLNKLAGNPRPFENNNQWAASFGGPIKKDKAFFFVNTEGIRYIFASGHTVTYPTPAFIGFVQGNVPQDAATQAFYTNLFNLYEKAPGFAQATPNADSCPGFTTAPGTTGGACTQSIFESVPNGNKEWLLSGRVDYNFDDNNKLFARVKFDRGKQPTYTDALNPVFNLSSVQPQDEGQLNYTHIFSPTVVNNFIGSVLWYSAIFGNPSPGAALAMFPGNLVFTLDGSNLAGVGTGSGNPGGFSANFEYPQGRNVTQWQLVDDVSVSRGNHNFKMGINFRRDDVSDYQSSVLAQYPVVVTSLLGLANDTIFEPGIGGNVQQNFTLSAEQPVAFYSFGLYGQDEYRVNSRLKFTLTLRADRNSGGACQSNCGTLGLEPFDQMAHGADIPYNAAFGGSFQTGRHSILPDVEKIVFQPRIGMAWSPIGQNTVIRGGVGLFTDLYPGTLLSNYTTNFPQVNAYNAAVGSVAFSETPSDFPSSGVNVINQCNAAFLSNFNTGGSLTTGGSSGGGYTGAIAAANGGAGIPGGCLSPATGNLIVPNFADTTSKVLNPKYVEWNLEVQHTFGARTVVSANYVGNRGFDELMINPYLNAFCPSPCTGAASSSGAGFDLTGVGLPTTAPDPRVQNVFHLTNAGYSNYNGVTFSLQEMNFHGVTARLNYTYSHAMDVNSNGGINPFSVITSVLTQIDPFNVKAQYAASDYDARHNITSSYVYALPFKSENRMMNAAIGGWQVSGTIFYRSAFPFTILDGATVGAIAANNLASGNVIAQPVSGFTQRTFSNGALCATVGCFTPADFQTTTGFTNPTVGRNAFRGPGFFGGDASIRKDFKLTERLNFQVGLNAFNVFNHANYGDPANNTSGAVGPFGQTIFMQSPPTSPYGAFAAAATDMRMAQIVGKLTF